MRLKKRNGSSAYLVEAPEEKQRRGSRRYLRPVSAKTGQRRLGGGSLEGEHARLQRGLGHGVGYGRPHMRPGLVLEKQSLLSG